MADRPVETGRITPKVAAIVAEHGGTHFYRDDRTVIAVHMPEEKMDRCLHLCSQAAPAIRTVARKIRFAESVESLRMTSAVDLSAVVLTSARSTGELLSRCSAKRSCSFG